jgi:drug/metabolite transporter (DMT)-like permease
MLTLLETLQPLVVLALARLFLGERLERSKLPYVALSICAASAIGFSGVNGIEVDPTYLLGLLFLLGGMVGSAASVIGGRRLSLKGVSATEITLMKFALGTVTLAPVALVSSSPAYLTQLSFGDYLYLILAAAGLGFGYLLHYLSLKALPATVSGFFDLLIPVTGVTLGVLCLDESLTRVQWAAIPILLWSVFRISM